MTIYEKAKRAVTKLNHRSCPVAICLYTSYYIYMFVCSKTEDGIGRSIGSSFAQFCLYFPRLV